MNRWATMALMVAVVSFLALLAVRPAGSTGTCATTTAAIDSQEQSFLTMLNAYRAQNGAGPLTISPGLTKAAAWMAEDLASHNYFSHTDTLGRLPWDRAIDCGYPSQSVGENIAGGRTGAASAFTAWQSSPGHNANMLNPNWRVIGIGRVAGGVFGGETWVTDFGVFNDGALPVATPTPTPAPTPTPVPVKTCSRWVGLSFCATFPEIARDG